jgi:hypothetical protein
VVKLVVRAFEAGDAAGWDALVEGSVNGTFIQTRRYLSYHRDRFTDASLVVVGDDGRLRGLLPAATDPLDERVVVSHPGITYGGLVHDGSVRGADLMAVLDDVVVEYRDRGYARLTYRPVPYIYHRMPAGDDLYAMFRLDATRSCNLSAAIDLGVKPTESKTRRQSRAKAAREGVHVMRGEQYLEPFWDILEAHLLERHDAHPVHTLDEMRWLMAAFPDNIECHGVVLGDDLIGGVVVYKTACVVRPQYAATTDVGKELAAQDVGMAAGIDDARQAGVRYYDLGTSNEDGGRVLNPSLYSYKMHMGAGGVPFETYEVDLTRGPVRG